MSGELDDPARGAELRRLIRDKPSLRRFYEEVYAAYAECIARCPREGISVELGSGGGFVKERIPEMITSDILPYEGVDQIVDATKMPFSEGSVRAICMLNVFHHIPDVARFLHEAERVLKPGGRLLLVDQHLGWLSTPIYRFVHNEPCDPTSRNWRFDSTGPVSGANGALAWRVFRLDLERFRQEFPGLRLVRYQPHTPLRYWLAGGLKKWTLLPKWAFGLATKLDRMLARMSEGACSFVNVEIERINAAASGDTAERAANQAS